MNKPTLFMAVVCAVAMGVVGPAMAQSGQLQLSLDALFETAQQNNTSIRSFQSAIEEAEAGISVAKGEQLPSLGLTASFSYLGGGFITDRNFSNAESIHIPHYGNNFALQASWAVYTGGAVRSGIRLSELNAQLARTSAAENQQNVRMLLVGYYLQLHNLGNQEKVYSENIALTQKLIEQTNHRQEEGVVLKNDITRYELQLENLKLGLTTVVNQKAIVNHQLATTLGVAQDVEILTQDNFELATGRVEGESFWQKQALESSPAIQQAEIGLKMSQQQEVVEKSALRPSVAIVAEDHLDGPITVEIPNIDKNINYFFVGVGIKYNFDALYKNNRRVKQARLATKTAEERKNQAGEQIGMAVQAAYTNYLTSVAELETSQKSVELAEQNYDVISNRYGNGLALVTDMVDAANQRLNAQLKLVNSRIGLLYSYYNLKYTTGTL